MKNMRKQITPEDFEEIRHEIVFNLLFDCLFALCKAGKYELIELGFQKSRFSEEKLTFLREVISELKEMLETPASQQ